MSRVVKPLTPEEMKALPKWQQAINKTPTRQFVFLGVIVILAVITIAVFL